MHEYIKKIINQKFHEIECINESIFPDDSVLKLLNARGLFRQSLQRNGLSFIAEIKRKSPSSGFMSEIPDVNNLARMYECSGASSISVLTDKEFFGGSLDDLKSISLNQDVNIPLLRKDFIVCENQIRESILFGANAILLIVAFLGDRTKKLYSVAKSLGLDVLVEVRSREEIDIALEAGADIIGINNRNLDDFSVDFFHCLDLVSSIPDHIIKVAESGISQIEHIDLLNDSEFDAVLIGSNLVESSDPGLRLKELRRCHEVN